MVSYLDGYGTNEVVKSEKFLATSSNVIRGNTIYKIVNGTSWTDANQLAKRAGGELLVVNNKEEEDYLISIYANPPYRDTDIESKRNAVQLWMGISDEEQEGQWLNPEGEPIKYSNWGSGEPSNHNGAEHNAVFLLYDNYNRNPGQWADIQMWNLSTQVLQKPLSAVVIRLCDCRRTYMGRSRS